MNNILGCKRTENIEWYNCRPRTLVLLQTGDLIPSAKLELGILVEREIYSATIA